MTFKPPILAMSILIAALPAARGATAQQPETKITESKDSLRAASNYLEVEVSLTRPQLVRLAVDSLGQGRFRPSALRAPLAVPPSGGTGSRSPAEAGTTNPPGVARRADAAVEYRRQGLAATAPARWTFEFGPRGMILTSRWTTEDPPEPLLLDFDPDRCHVTLLGPITASGGIRLPALLHLPDQGTFRITGPAGSVLDYDARRNVGPYVKVTFPPATQAMPRVEYRWEVTAIYPRLATVENDPRFDGFCRNWLNIFQVNPRMRILANNAASDTAAFCLYEYADIALHTPVPVSGSGSPSMLDLVRQSLERYLGGFAGYGLPGYTAFDFTPGPTTKVPFLDAYPSLLISAADYVAGSGDDAWLKANYGGLRKWAEALLAMDRDGDGLFEYALSGNSGSWTRPPPKWTSNWWDSIGFGHKDAYGNALAYRALRGMEALATRLDKPDDAARLRAAADKLRAAYYKTFYSPATGVLAGWRSADGQLHDYYFLFVNGIAIHYGLVPKDKANAMMDKLLAKMKAVGFNRFELGLPGNLVSIAPGDFLDSHERWGGGPNGFQKYENGGATGCFAYFTLAALYDLGRREEADRILFPMLQSFADGAFQGRAPDDLAYDWKDWNGKPHGYEGFLVDNYYALLAVLVREGQLRRTPGMAPVTGPGVAPVDLPLRSGNGPDPIFEKPQPITLAELAGRKIEGVEAVEVCDYAPIGYKGELKPSPPHADFNPKKAVIIAWGKHPQRFVFSHEASYCPWLELPNGVGLCNQFFECEGGDLFSDTGRRERNSFVDVIRSGPDRVWVRWNYFCVGPRDDSHPNIRGTEDYIAYPNGLVWRRLTYHTMMPGQIGGYSWQPIDFFAPAPVGTGWKDLYPRDPEHGDYNVAVALDAYSGKTYRLYWDDRGKPRRVGDAELLWQIAKSKGFAMVMPFKAGHLFVVLGQSSGFPAEKSQIVDHSFDDTGGWGWRSDRWDHWPIGWLNSQLHHYQPGSPYPYHFCPFSHYMVSKRIVDCRNDFPVMQRDMELNRWSERHVYYTLSGVGHDLESVRRLARQWLDKGKQCANPESIAGLK